MYSLANFCYVCLEKKDKLLSDINSSLSVNKDIIHIIDYLPVNLAWLKTLQIILICDECCLRLRDIYQYLEKCSKNSALLQAYMDKLNITPISNAENEAELLVKLNITHKAVNEVKSEDEDEICIFKWHPNIEETGNVFVDFEDSLVKEGIICRDDVGDKQEYPTDNNCTEETEDVDFEDSLVKEGVVCKREVDAMQDNNSTEIIEETEDVFVNVEDYFVKEENTWKREEADNVDEYPTGNNSTENIDNESDPDISLNDNAYVTNTDCVSSGQAHARNVNDLNAAAKKSNKCSTCNKSFSTKSNLNVHTRTHTDEKPFACAICKKRFRQKEHLVLHMRIHTGEKPFECSNCKKCFTDRSHLVRHARIHTDEKQFECAICKKRFRQNAYLVLHKRIHTGENPFECSNCKRCFTQSSNLVSHMRIHTGEKPFECSNCKKCFSIHCNLVSHMRIHTGEKPFECSNCKKCFTNRSNLVSHMRIHTGEKPFECSNCKKCFTDRSHLVRHARIHTGEKPLDQNTVNI